MDPRPGATGDDGAGQRFGLPAALDEDKPLQTCAKAVNPVRCLAVGFGSMKPEQRGFLLARRRDHQRSRQGPGALQP
jgi:hypothetical protein